MAVKQFGDRAADTAEPPDERLCGASARRVTRLAAS
jgi:hypothetical protein